MNKPLAMREIDYRFSLGGKKQYDCRLDICPSGLGVLVIATNIVSQGKRAPYRNPEFTAGFIFRLCADFDISRKGLVLIDKRTPLDGESLEQLRKSYNLEAHETEHCVMPYYLEGMMGKPEKEPDFTVLPKEQMDEFYALFEKPYEPF